MVELDPEPFDEQTPPHHNPLLFGSSWRNLGHDVVSFRVKPRRTTKLVRLHVIRRHEQRSQRGISPNYLPRIGGSRASAGGPEVDASVWKNRGGRPYRRHFKRRAVDGLAQHE